MANLDDLDWMAFVSSNLNTDINCVAAWTTEGICCSGLYTFHLISGINQIYKITQLHFVFQRQQIIDSGTPLSQVRLACVCLMLAVTAN